MALPPLLSLRDVQLGFGGLPLFDGVDMAVGRGDRICLVGRNGSGKSTLLKIIAGQIEPENGDVFVQPGTRLSWLPQEPDVSRFRSVYDYVAGGFEGDQDHALHRVTSLLDELGLDPDADPCLLSGGEKRRAAIARLLVCDPDIMLLDEPTNHLDLPTIQWLESKLRSCRSGFIVISHDRAFLNNLTNVTLWLDRGVVRRLDRGFSAFEEWAETILEQETVERAKFDKLIAKETEWLRQGVKARRTRNMGRVQRLYDMRQERAGMIAQAGRVAMGIDSGALSGKLVIEAVDIAKTFSGRCIIKPLSVRVLRGDRIGIIGPNGAGKSTLLKMLLGELSPDSGSVRLGTALSPVFLDQTRSLLDPEKTVWDTLADTGGDSINVRGTMRHVVGYMRDFLFSESQARSPVGSLSGGERNRLILAKTLAAPSNLLVLDEPTNDLDMDTLDLLQDALSFYDGTLLLVSHDRDFLDRIVTSSLVFEGEGVIREYPGGYSDYERQRKPVEDTVPVISTKKNVSAERSEAPRVMTKLSYAQARLLKELPRTIEQARKEVVALEAKLSCPNFYAVDPSAFAETVERLETKKAFLEQAEEQWLELEILKEDLESSGRREG